MHQLVPDKRWRTLIKSVVDKKVPEDLYLQKVYRVMIGDAQDDDVAFALDMINTPIERDYMMAYFLSGASYEYICKSIGLKDEVCRNFGHLYIDMGVFRHKLEIMRYADYYIKNVAEGEQIELIRQAMRQGPEYVTNFLDPSSGDIIDVEKISARLLTQSFYAAGIARSLSLDSSLSRQALKWLGVATKLISSAKDHSVHDDDELHLSIIEMQQNHTLESMQIPQNDLAH